MTQAAVVDTSSGSRTHRQKLSREVVEHAAITVARTEGFGALSIRNVARVLGVAPMALYTHVKNKDELAEHVADALIGGIETRTQGSLVWQDRVRTLLRAHRDLVLKQPDMTPYIASAGAAGRTGAGTRRFNDALVSALAAAGFDSETADELSFMLITYNYGSVVTAKANGAGAATLLKYNDGLSAILKAYEARATRPALGLVDSMRDRLRFRRK
jgi:AcrR family transcriptional regulator